MAKKDLLLNLIHSLSANEKRYFSLFSPGSDSQNYRKLFNALEEEDSYNSKEIRMKLGATSMNIAYEKSYLQKMLMRSLRNFYDGSTDEITLHNALINIEVLFNKQQYELCFDLIRQSKQLAENGERYQQQLSLIQWEKRCMVRLGKYDYLEKQFTRGLKGELQILSLLQNLSEYRSLQLYMLSLTYKKGNIKRSTDWKKLEEIIRHPLMKSVRNAKSFRARLMYYEILFSWHHHNYNIEKAYYYNKLALQLFDKSPQSVANNAQSYFSVLANFFNRALALNKMTELEPIIQKLEVFSNQYAAKLPSSLVREMRSGILERKMIVFTYNRDYVKSAALAESMAHELESPRSLFRPAFFIVFYYFAALSCFYLRKYDKSLVYSRKIIDGFDKKVRLDFIFTTYLLHFLTHFEMGHTDLLPYLQKSIQRFATSHDLLTPANKVLIKFFQELSKPRGNEARVALVIKQYYKLLLPYKNDTTQNIALETLDLFHWLDRKLKPAGNGN